VIPLKDDNPTYSTPIITYFIIGICVIVFLLEISSSNYKSGAIFYSWGVIPASLIHNLQLPDEVYRVPPIITLFTSMFMHGGFMHLIGNMLYMWIFADNIEDGLGKTKFIIFPEGTRIDPEKTAKINPGFFAIHKITKVPILPVIHNSGRFWINKKFIKKNGKINIKIFPLLKSNYQKDKILNDIEAKFRSSSF